MGQYTGWRSLRRLFQEQEKENEGSQQAGGRHHPLCQAVWQLMCPFQVASVVKLQPHSPVLLSQYSGWTSGMAYNDSSNLQL